MPQNKYNSLMLKLNNLHKERKTSTKCLPFDGKQR